MKIESEKPEFNLSFPALVTLYTTDSTGNIEGLQNKPTRTNEGKQSLSLLDKLQSGKLILVAAGTVIGMQDLPKTPHTEEKRESVNGEEAP